MGNAVLYSQLFHKLMAYDSHMRPQRHGILFIFLFFYYYFFLGKKTWNVLGDYDTLTPSLYKVLGHAEWIT